MVVLVYAKPVLYLIAFWLAHRRFKAYGPHSKLPGWGAILFASLVRMALGVVGYLALANVTSTEVPFFGGLIVLGFAWWLLVAKAFFWRTPRAQLVGFAAIGEILSIALDIAAMVEMRDFKFC
jgi:hypothetical protein